MGEDEKNVPVLRFAEFEGVWVKKKAGAAFSNSKEKGKADIPIYSVTLSNGLVPRDSLERHMQADAATETNLLVQPNDLVYNMMRMWQGAVGFANDECMVSPAYVVLRPAKDTHSKFFVLWFKTNAGLYKLWAYSHGLTSDRLRLYYNDFAQIPVSYPGRKEQKKIAAFLGAVNNKLGVLRRKKDLLTDYKRGLMQRLFSQQYRFKKEDGTDYPDWEEKRLGDIAKKITEKNVNFKHNRVFTNSAVQGVVDQGDYFDKDIANENNLGGYYIIKKGDFVYNPRISVSAPVGPIKRNNLGFGVMSPLYTIFRFFARYTNYFELYFQTTLWHRHMCSVANYGARHDRMNITGADFLNMPLPVPHLDEQQKIADCLNAMDTKIEAVATQIRQIETFKKGLLQQMFV